MSILIVSIYNTAICLKEIEFIVEDMKVKHPSTHTLQLFTEMIKIKKYIKVFKNAMLDGLSAETKWSNGTALFKKCKQLFEY